jgi:hypothetical protein
MVALLNHDCFSFILDHISASNILAVVAFEVQA